MRSAQAAVVIVLLGVITGFGLVFFISIFSRYIVYHNDVQSVKYRPLTNILIQNPNSTINGSVEWLAVRVNSSTPMKQTPITPIPGIAPEFRNYMVANKRVAEYRNRRSECHGTKFQPNIDNIFLYHAICNITNSVDIVQFSGQRINRLFEANNNLPHLVVDGNLRARFWGQIAEHINTSFESFSVKRGNDLSKNQPKAVHVHNHHKLGDLLLLFREEYLKTAGRRAARAIGTKPLTRAQMHKAMDKGQAPMVMTNWGDENWGVLSAPINSRTTSWLNLTNHLRIHFSNYANVHDMLDSSKMVLFLCNTHVAPGIGAHRKVLSLPLGMKAKALMFRKALTMLSTPYTKKNTLSINNSGWGDRELINAMVEKAFNHTIRNTYTGAMKRKRANPRAGRHSREGKKVPVPSQDKGRPSTLRQLYSQPCTFKQSRPTAEARYSTYTPRDTVQGSMSGMLSLPPRHQRQPRRLVNIGGKKDHHMQSALAKFVLCPSELGFDTYRIWETLLLGSIPIVESNAGFDRTYSNLPVLVVRNYSDVTPQLLEQAYPCFVEHAHLYNYHHLTESYWLNLIFAAVRTGRINHVDEEHPFRNKYCDFLYSK